MDNKDKNTTPTENTPTSNQDATNSEATRSTEQAATNDDRTPETSNQDATNEAATSRDTTNNQNATSPETNNQSVPNLEAETNRETSDDQNATSLQTTDTVPPNPEMSNQGRLAQETSELETAELEPIPMTIRKAARFDPTTEEPGTIIKGWRTQESQQPSPADRELEADMFEAVLFHVGEFGRYQKLLLVAIIPYAVYFSWVYFTPMFLLLTPKPFWCFVPELAFLSKELRRDLSAPGVSTGHWDGCKVYKVDWNTVLKTMKPPPADTPLMKCKTGWEHEYKEIPYETVVSERGWVCDKAKYSLTSQSAFFAGSLAGGLTFGWMADTYGRVPALIGVNMFGGIAGMVTIFTIGAWDFILCRFFYGMAYDNCFMIAYILVLEYVGPSHRTLVANLPLVLYDGTGAVALPWIAYAIASWRWFSFVTSMALFIGCLAPWLLPESARWLISRGRVDEAVKVIKRFEKVNKSHIPEPVLKTFINSAIDADKKKKEQFFTMFESELIRITAIFMAIAYCSLAVAYDALVRLSESFGFDFFITFTINAVVEIPSVIMVALLLDRLGRRNLTFGPTVLGAIFIIIAMFVPKGVPRVCFAVVARFLINLSYTVSVQWVAEILPTPFRATGSAAMHMCGFASSLMSPFIVYSERYWSLLPLLILTVLSLLGAAFSLLLPETKGEEMPQTIADAEDIIKENSLYGPKETGIRQAFSSIRSSTFIEPIHRRPEGRVSLRLSRLAFTFK